MLVLVALLVVMEHVLLPKNLNGIVLEEIVLTVATMTQVAHHLVLMNVALVKLDARALVLTRLAAAMTQTTV